MNLAKFEFDVVKKINEEAKQLQRYQAFKLETHCLKPYETFDFMSNNQKHWWLVFESLGKSLFAFIQDNKYKGFPIDQVMRFARDLFQGLKFIHGLGITHTDIKPENILLVSDKHKIVNNPEEIPSQVRLKKKIFGEILGEDDKSLKDLLK